MTRILEMLKGSTRLDLSKFNEQGKGKTLYIKEVNKAINIANITQVTKIMNKRSAY